jgi:hypothetical protein
MEIRKSKISKMGLQNTYCIYDDYAELRFSNAPEIFIIDINIIDDIINYQWYPRRSNWGTYCSGYVNKKVIVLHRYLMNAESGQYVDHINKNTQDNRISNLRFVTNQENGCNRKLGKNNTSGIMGVFLDIKHNKWVSQIKVNYKYMYIGCFENKDDAIISRLKAEKEYFGEFSPQKDLFEKYGI